MNPRRVLYPFFILGSALLGLILLPLLVLPYFIDCWDRDEWLNPWTFWREL